MGGGSLPSSVEGVANDLQGEEVLAVYSPVASLGWLVFVELPVVEAYAPIYASVFRSGVLMIAALSLAVLAGTFLARRMVIPIRALRDGAARIGSGDLNQRIPMPPLNARSRNARNSSSWPISLNPASWRPRAMICASLCMPWACSLRNCAAI
jgi:methyl-accepting chemotaxis protein